MSVLWSETPTIHDPNNKTQPLSQMTTFDLTPIGSLLVRRGAVSPAARLMFRVRGTGGVWGRGSSSLGSVGG